LGPAAPLAYILGAALFAPIVLCFAAAGSRFTTTGGPYRYVESAFGRFPGVLIAALFWISNVAGSGGMAAILVSQATHILPALEQPVPRALFLAAVYAVLYSLNARGVRLGARAIIVFALAKMLPLLVLAAGGLMFVHPENLRIVTAPDWQSLGKSLVVAGLPIPESRPRWPHPGSCAIRRESFQARHSLESPSWLCCMSACRLLPRAYWGRVVRERRATIGNRREVAGGVGRTRGRHRLGLPHWRAPG